MNNKQLLYDISELNNLFRESASIQTLLDKTVEMVASHTQSDVCSVYLYNSENRELILSATRGLNPESVGKVRLKLGQGLTGLALKELRPVLVILRTVLILTVLLMKCGFPTQPALLTGSVQDFCAPSARQPAISQ